MADNLDSWLALALAMADASGVVARRYFRTPVAIDDKNDSSPVTVADRESEKIIRDMIARACPDHGVIGEEHGADRPGASHVWVVDPIDGTKSFITGRPLFGSLIALCRDGRPILGVIDCSAAGERWAGVAGRPTTHQYAGRKPAPVRTRPCPTLAPAAICATSPYMFEGTDTARFDALRRATKLVVFGSDCYGYGLCASGFVDLVVEASLKVYDYAALVPVLEGAGGTISDWQGRPLGLESDGRVLAAGDARCHAAALPLLAG
ncbi:MAG: histidinol-phosphatase [Rhodospirillales bacterium]|nr:histidinol-phosphatase [Rhodospirillales bacterium]